MHSYTSPAIIGAEFHPLVFSFSSSTRLLCNSVSSISGCLSGFHGSEIKQWTLLFTFSLKILLMFCFSLYFVPFHLALTLFRCFFCTFSLASPTVLFLFPFCFFRFFVFLISFFHLIRCFFSSPLLYPFFPSTYDSFYRQIGRI